MFSFLPSGVFIIALYGETDIMRWLFIAFGGIAGLLLAAIAAVVLLFDPNDYRDQLAAAVESETGRTFTLSGDIGWSLFPRLSIDLGAVRLGSGTGFPDRPLVSAEGLSAGLAVMPLFAGHIELETLELRRPTINLIRNAEGVGNWQLDRNGGQTATGSGGMTPPPEWLAGLSLGGIDLSDGRIRYEDQTTGDVLTADPINLDLGAVTIGQATSLTLEALIRRGDAQWDTRLAGDVTIRRDGSLSLRDTTLTANELEISEISTDISPTASGWRIHPLSAVFYDGDYSGDIRLQTEAQNMPLRFDESLNGVAMGPLLAAFTGFERVTGEAGMAASGALALSSGNPPLASLTADGEFSIRDGALRGINIARIIRQALARLEGRTPPPDTETPETDFTSFTGSVSVRDGVASSDDISLDSPLLRVRGSGQSDLVEQTLALRLDVNIVGSIEGQGGETLESLRGVAIPLQIEGSWDQPRVSVDVARVLQESQGTRIRERIEEEVDELRNRLEGLMN